VSKCVGFDNRGDFSRAGGSFQDSEIVVKSFEPDASPSAKTHE
jgi:hypothetical protein